MSYLDIWMLMCIIFIFFVLLEFAFVFNCLKRSEKPKGEALERIMIIVLPCLFLCFNFIYWLSILTTGPPAQ